MSKLEKVDTGRPVSKYAQKKAAEREGTRSPFEFVERKKIVSGGQVSLPLPPKVLPVKSVTIEDGAIVSARIAEWNNGYLFLYTKNNIKIFMSLKTLRKSHFDDLVIIGTVLECKVGPQPNGKGPQVTKVLSILPTL